MYCTSSSSIESMESAGAGQRVTMYEALTGSPTCLSTVIGVALLAGRRSDAYPRATRHTSASRPNILPGKA